MICKDCKRNIRDGSVVCPECGAVNAVDISHATCTVLVNRAFIYLEDGEFEKAVKCLDAVIETEPQNAKAYLGRLLADLKTRTPAELARYPKPFDKNKYFIKAYELADGELKAELELYSLTRTPQKNPPREKAPTEPPKPIEPPVQKPVQASIEPPKPTEQPNENTPPQKPDVTEISKGSNRAAVIVLIVIAALLGVCIALLFILGRSSVIVLTSDPNLGEVSGGGGYWIWEKATITATPGEGCSFVNWSDGSTENPRVVEADGSFYKAIFSSVPSAEISLSVGSGKGEVKGGGVYPLDNTVEIEAIPDGDSEFIRWSDGSTSAKRKIKITHDIEYIAYFSTGKMYTISVTTPDKFRGTVSGSGSFDEGAEITVEAVPKDGYIFAGWSDGVTDAVRKIIVSENVSLVANFALASSKARVGNVYYQTLEEAISNAKIFDTVTLLSDVKLNSPLTIKNKTLTIDGGGHSISMAGVSEVIAFSAVSTASKLTLKDLVVKNTSASSHTGGTSIPQCIALYKNASLVLDNCALEVVNKNGSAITTNDTTAKKFITASSCDITAGNVGFDLNSNTKLEINDITVVDAPICVRFNENANESELNAGESTFMSKNGSGVFEFHCSGAVVKLYDCEIYVTDNTADYTCYLVYVYGGSKNCEVTILGYNSFVSISAGAALLGQRSGGSGSLIADIGGTYNTSHVTNHLAPGRKAVKNTDGTWTVK